MPERKEEDDREEEEQKAEQAEKQRRQNDRLTQIPYKESNANYFDVNNTYRVGNGIDFYVDQARYLPDNVTFTRLTVRGVTSAYQKIVPTTRTFCELEESARMIQVYNHRVEIRPETLTQKRSSLDPTTYMEIMIETIDRSDMNEKTVGFAYFPLFMDDRQEPVTDASSRDFVFN